MNVAPSVIRTELERRAKQLYDDEYTTLITEWTDGEGQLTVYHTRLFHSPDRPTTERWFHIWQMIDVETIYEYMAYVEGDLSYLDAPINVNGYTDISDDVHASLEWTSDTHSSLVV